MDDAIPSVSVTSLPAGIQMSQQWWIDLEANVRMSLIQVEIFKKVEYGPLDRFFFYAPLHSGSTSLPATIETGGPSVHQSTHTGQLLRFDSHHPLEDKLGSPQDSVTQSRQGPHKNQEPVKSVLSTV